MALPMPVLAQGGFMDRIKGGVDTAASPAGLQQTGTLQDIIGGIISVALGFIGVLLFALFIYAGFLWMTAGGNEEQVKKAKGLIMNAVIGLIIVIASYAIADFVLTQLSQATSGAGTSGAETSPP